MTSGFYREDVTGADLCHIEGCIGRGPCPRCGETNYALMGFYGAVARWAKAWGVSEDEALNRMTQDRRESMGLDELEWPP